MADMKKEVISFRDAHVEPGDYGGLNGLDLLIEEGEIINLIGITGSGKTMLYKYLIGEKALDKGKVIFDGKKIKRGHIFTETKDVICIGHVNTLLSNISIGENISVITKKRKTKGIIRIRNMKKRINFI